MRIKGIGLEHHRKASFGGWRCSGIHIVDGNCPAGQILKPRNHAQQCGFAAARGAYENRELAILDREIERRDDLGVTEFFGDLIELDFSHGTIPILPRRR